MTASVRRVGLNALFLAPGHSGGPETYLRQLAPALVRTQPSVRFAVATTRSGARALKRDGFDELLDVHALPAEDGQRVRRTGAEQVLLGALARRRGWDVLHSLASIAPIRPPVASVITLHDVIFLRHRTFGRVTTSGMSWFVRRAGRSADALITGSVAARNEICAVLDLDPASFTVIPHGVGRSAEIAPAPESELRERYGLDGGRIVLCVGAKRPHKNQELLVRAATRLPDDLVVALVGAAEPYDRRLRALSDRLGVQDRLRFIEYVPDRDLEGLFALAACAAFPTLDEGFGLPLLEALQRGVPVACSDIPVLRELGADAAHYFDPHDPAKAAGAILEAIADAEATRRGPQRAGSFSWEEAAAATFEVYERALARRS
jgi:glycosyltransferase involved in cell wall biosynthesis